MNKTNLNFYEEDDFLTSKNVIILNSRDPQCFHKLVEKTKEFYDNKRNLEMQE